MGSLSQHGSVAHSAAQCLWK